MYGYVQNNPINLSDALGLEGYCGSGGNEPYVPENPGGYPFGEPCAKHDKCYEDQKGFDYCNDQFGIDMDAVCNSFDSFASTPGWKDNAEHHEDTNWGPSREECLGYSAAYEGAVNAFGGGAYSDAGSGSTEGPSVNDDGIGTAED